MLSAILCCLPLLIWHGIRAESRSCRSSLWIYLLFDCWSSRDRDQGTRGVWLEKFQVCFAFEVEKRSLLRRKNCQSKKTNPETRFSLEFAREAESSWASRFVGRVTWENVTGQVEGENLSADCGTSKHPTVVAASHSCGKFDLNRCTGLKAHMREGTGALILSVEIPPGT